MGHLDADGYLLITDRKKELLKTAGGKFVAPQPIENLLKSSPYISNALVVGDRHKFVIASDGAEFSAIERRRSSWVAIRCAASRRWRDPWVRDLICGEIERPPRAGAIREAQTLCAAANRISRMAEAS